MIARSRLRCAEAPTGSGHNLGHNHLRVDPGPLLIPRQVLGYHCAMSEAGHHRRCLDERAWQQDIYPENRFSGRGIVICAGGLRYFTNAYVSASVLRRHGCTLPIQFWHLGPAEMTDEMRQLVAHLDVTTVDAHVYAKPIRRGR